MVRSMIGSIETRAESVVSVSPEHGTVVAWPTGSSFRVQLKARSKTCN